MEDTNLILFIAIQVATLLIIALVITLVITLKKLRTTRLNYMRSKREIAAQTLQLEKLKDTEAPKNEGDPSTYQLEEYLSLIKTWLKEHELDINDLEASALKTAEEKLIYLSYQFVTLMQDRDMPPDIQNLLESRGLSLLESTADGQHSEPDDEKEVSESADNETSEVADNQDNHYEKLYSELLITLTQTKDLLKKMVLRLAEVIDDGCDEGQLNQLLDDLNSSMDTLAELSGITTSDGAQQLEDEVKVIKQAYQKGMDLMECFELAVKESASLNDVVDEHSEVIEKNNSNYEEGETVDREAVLGDIKRYSRLIDQSRIGMKEINKQIAGAQEIIGDFIAMTRKFQDQSTRIVILQSREKQLNDDLKQVKATQQDAINSLYIRDHQLAALVEKYILEQPSENADAIIELAKEIYDKEQALKAYEQAKSAEDKKAKQELVQQRLGLEAQIESVIKGEAPQSVDQTE